MIYELKECPWCQRTPTIHKEEDNYMIKCKPCRLTTIFHCDTIEAASKLWNDNIEKYCNAVKRKIDMMGFCPSNFS